MKVKSENYTHEFHYLSANEIFFDRKQKYCPGYEEIDVYGGFWSFLFAKLPEGSVTICINNKDVSVSGAIGVFIPAHAVVHWKINSPFLHWFAYSNRLPADDNFPKDLTLFSLPNFEKEISPEWIREFIVKSSDKLVLSQMHINPYAKKLKTLLDKDYKLNTSLQSYALGLGISKEWLIKYFKKSYGLTPINYRNRKRLMDTLFALHVDKEKIVDLSHDMGFQDLKHFNALFKKVISALPSQFLPGKLALEY
ncbi:MAG: helix-turn-helix transcriptional regulator [Bdellovibrionaceae bacterium]|nr:helix-turn-helix transcriptional regulator [Pseudobdellovibrionaceae bacterium]